jgi:hypothetical protein
MVQAGQTFDLPNASTLTEKLNRDPVEIRTLRDQPVAGRCSGEDRTSYLLQGHLLLRKKRRGGIVIFGSHHILAR